MSANTPRPRWTDRVRDAALWMRDTGLGGLGFALVLVVAVSGWAASFIGLHDFGMNHMGLSERSAWLVPITFDGAPAGLSIVVMRAAMHGRPALVWRLLIVAFTGLSSWINYVHIEDQLGRTVASFMPPSAVVLFEGLMSEARAAAGRRNGKVPPRLHPLRWVFDRKGTWKILRAYVLDLELPEELQRAATNLTTTAPQGAPTPAPVAPPGAATGAPQSAPKTPQGAATGAPGGAAKPAPVSLQKNPQGAPKGAPVAPRGAAPKAPQGAPGSAPKAPSKRPGKVTRADAKDALRALYDDLGRRPLESEMVDRLRGIKYEFTSRQHANKLRGELEEKEPHLAALGSTNVRALTGTGP